MTTDLVTGAFSYSGRFVATRLLAAGRHVRTLTAHNRPGHSLSGQVEVHPFSFNDPKALTQALEGVTTVYNTYWTRYAEAGTNHPAAVRHTQSLLDAAVVTGVERFVHISITNPDPTSFYPYYRGKAVVEEAVKASGLSYAIVRPTVLFGEDDVLINDIAWLTRHFPIFTVPGDGQYQLRPVATADLADLMVRLGSERENVVIDAVGPERYAFRDLVELIARTLGTRCRVTTAPARLVGSLLPILNRVTGDVVLTRDEIRGLMTGYIDSDGPTTCPTSFAEYLRVNRDRVGTCYQAELVRR